MRRSPNYLAEFIGEQVEMLAKMARLDGFDDLAFILQVAQVEAKHVQKQLHESDDYTCAD